MRKVALIGTALVFGLTSTAWAGAKDKSSNTLVDVDGEGTINNTTAKTKIKSKGCTLQIQATVGLPDGEIVICVAEADVLQTAGLTSLGGNGAVVVGEAKAGKLKIKADLTEVQIAGQACGQLDVIQQNGNVRCFRDDATYRGDANIPGSWRADCADEVAPLASTTVSESELKANAGVPVIPGICQILGGGRLEGPASDRIAVQGGRIGLE